MQEEDNKSGVSKDDEQAHIEIKQKSMDDILSSLGGLEGDEYESLNFDNGFRGNQKPKCDIDTCVS